MTDRDEIIRMAPEAGFEGLLASEHVARKRLSHTQRQQAYRNRKKLRLLELRG